MPELRQRRSGCPIGGKHRAGWSFPLVSLLSTPGILPYALRASFAVRARILRARGHAKKVTRAPKEDESSCSARKLRYRRTSLKCDACLRRHDEARVQGAQGAVSVFAGMTRWGVRLADVSGGSGSFGKRVRQGQEISNSAAEGRRKLFALRAASPQAYQLKCDACLRRHDGVGDRGFPRFRGEAEPIVPR